MVKILSAIALGSVLSACSSEEPSGFERKALSLQVAVESETRVSETSFDDGDRVGVFVMCRKDGQALPLSGADAYVANRLFVYEGAMLSAKEIVYYPEEESDMDVYAYYPYSGEVSSVSAYPFRVAADQSEVSNYKSSDFLWAKGTVDYHAAGNANLVFGHRMSRMEIRLRAGEGVASLEGAEVVVAGVALASEVHLGTGEVTATGECGEVIPFHATDRYRVLVPPQHVEGGKKLIRVMLNGKRYSYVTPVGGIRLEAGKTMSFTLTLNDREQDLGD